MFFDVCGGRFLQYALRAAHLVTSLLVHGGQSTYFNISDTGNATPEMLK